MSIANLRRTWIKQALLLGSISTRYAKWTTPVVTSVVLPAHAQTSSCFRGLWQFDILIEARRDVANGGTAVQINPPLAITRTFEISSEEVSTGTLIRDIDFDGQGPAADYQFVRYSISERTCTSLTGEYRDTNVDTGIERTGTWTASP